MEAFKFDNLVYANLLSTPTFYYKPCVKDDVKFCKTKSQIKNAEISLEIIFFEGLMEEDYFYAPSFTYFFDVDIDYNS